MHKWVPLHRLPLFILFHLKTTAIHHQISFSMSQEGNSLAKWRSRLPRQEMQQCCSTLQNEENKEKLPFLSFRGTGDSPPSSPVASSWRFAFWACVALSPVLGTALCSPCHVRDHREALNCPFQGPCLLQKQNVPSRIASLSWSVWGCHPRKSQTRGLEQRIIIFSQSWRLKSKSRVSAGWVSCDTSLLGL